MARPPKTVGLGILNFGRNSLNIYIFLWISIGISCWRETSYEIYYQIPRAVNRCIKKTKLFSYQCSLEQRTSNLNNHGMDCVRAHLLDEKSQEELVRLLRHILSRCLHDIAVFALLTDVRNVPVWLKAGQGCVEKSEIMLHKFIN